jgi:hypothetical protein
MSPVGFEPTILCCHVCRSCVGRLQIVFVVVKRRWSIRLPHWDEPHLTLEEIQNERGIVCAPLRCVAISCFLNSREPNRRSYENRSPQRSAKKEAPRTGGDQAENDQAWSIESAEPSQNAGEVNRDFALDAGTRAAARSRWTESLASPNGTAFWGAPTAMPASGQARLYNLRGEVACRESFKMKEARVLSTN